MANAKKDENGVSTLLAVSSVDGTTPVTLYANPTTHRLLTETGASGDVVGPASATDNAIVRFDGTTGKLVQDSVVTIADTTGVMSLLSNSTAINLGASSDVVMNRYGAKQLRISGDGIGATTNAGWILGYYGVSGVSAIWPSVVTPSASNYAFLAESSTTQIQGTTVYITAGIDKIVQTSTAGRGPTITAGTAVTDVNALNVAQTWNEGSTSFTGVLINITDTAAAGGSNIFKLTRNATETAFQVGRLGIIRANGTQSQMYFGASGSNYFSLAQGASGGNMTAAAGGIWGWSSAGTFSDSPTMDTAISRVSAGVLAVGTGTAASTAGTLQVAKVQQIGSANNRATSNLILYGATTDSATAVELTTNGAAGSGATNRIAVPTDTSLSIVLNIGVKQSGSVNAKQMLRQVVITNNGGTTALSGTPIALGTDTGDAGLATVTTTITANNTDDCLSVVVNGVAATNLRYTCYVVSCETLY